MAPSAPRVFISYSHDSFEHARRVMGLAERLRKDGVDAQLDQYVAGTPARGWPRWMEEQLDSSEFVLVICTETYRQRFLGREERTGKAVSSRWSYTIPEVIRTNSCRCYSTVKTSHSSRGRSRAIPIICLVQRTTTPNFTRFLPAKPASCPVSLARLRRGRAKLSSR